MEREGVYRLNKFASSFWNSQTCTFAFFYHAFDDPSLIFSMWSTIKDKKSHNLKLKNVLIQLNSI